MGKNEQDECRLKQSCKCGKKWDYKGQNKNYATCPDCKSSVKIISKQMEKSVKQ